MGKVYADPRQRLFSLCLACHSSLLPGPDLPLYARYRKCAWRWGEEPDRQDQDRFSRKQEDQPGHTWRRIGYFLFTQLSARRVAILCHPFLLWLLCRFFIPVFFSRFQV